MTKKTGFDKYFDHKMKNTEFAAEYTKAQNVIDKITLMMVTFNRLDLTKQTLNNLIKTIKTPCNLVIIDNFSTDNTLQYLHDMFAKKQKPFSQVKIVSFSENKGIAVGRNAALKEADEIGTQWYCTIDNDVKLPEGWLEECVQILKNNKNFGAVGVNLENNKYPIVKRGNLSFQEKPAGNLGTACMVFRKQLHQMLGFFSTEYGKYGEEDSDFGMRARVAGFKLGYIERMGKHLGADESEVNDYRKFKTKQHADNLALFKQNCALYAQRKKPIYIPYKD